MGGRGKGVMCMIITLMSISTGGSILFICFNDLFAMGVLLVVILVLLDSRSLHNLIVWGKGSCVISLL